MATFDPDEQQGEAPTADFDVAGRAFEDAKAEDVRHHAGQDGAPRWVTWAVIGFFALAAAGFIADRGWMRTGAPYASWYWPDEAPGLQIAHGGSRWVLDTRQRAVLVEDEHMVPVGTFNNVTYFAPRGGGGGPAEVVGPLYIRVGPDRFIPLVPGGPTVDQMKRRMLEGEPMPPTGVGG